jgi:hypothetical protein
MNDDTSHVDLAKTRIAPYGPDVVLDSNGDGSGQVRFNGEVYPFTSHADLLSRADELPFPVTLKQIYKGAPIEYWQVQVGEGARQGSTVVDTRTVTLTREDGTVLTCTINVTSVSPAHLYKGHPLQMLVFDKALDADGKEVRTTQWENILCYEAAKAKRTEARWDDDV